MLTLPSTSASNGSHSSLVSSLLCSMNSSSLLPEITVRRIFEAEGKVDVSTPFTDVAFIWTRLKPRDTRVFRKLRRERRWRNVLAKRGGDCGLRSFRLGEILRTCRHLLILHLLLTRRGGRLISCNRLRPCTLCRVYL